MLKTVIVCALLAGAFADSNDTAVKNETARGQFFPYAQQPGLFPQQAAYPPQGAYQPQAFAPQQPIQQGPYGQPTFVQQPYGQPQYAQPQQYPAYPQVQFSTPFYAPKLPITDDYICDTEATILVVTNAQETDVPAASPENNANTGNTGGYGNNVAQNPGFNNNPYGPVNQPAFSAPNPAAQPNADRLKCSVVAATDAHSCNVCCQLAARHDHSISQNDIKGFIVDDNQVDHTSQIGANIRAKREGSYGASSLNELPAASPGNGGNGENICVCCAPRRQLNNANINPFYPQYQPQQQFVAFAPPTGPY